MFLLVKPISTDLCINQAQAWFESIICLLASSAAFALVFFNYSGFLPQSKDILLIGIVIVNVPPTNFPVIQDLKED